MIQHSIRASNWSGHRGVLRCDAIVVGGGPSGCAAAISLSRTGARVLLLERRTRAVFKPGEIVGSSVLQPLASLGLRDRFLARESLTLAGRLIVWDDATGSEIPAIFDPYGDGFVVDRVNLESWLLDEAHAAGVSVMQGTAILAAERVARGWSIIYEAQNGHTCVEAPLLLEATGRGSGVVGRGLRRHLDRLVALVVQAPAPPDVHDQRLIIEAAVDGWWYGALLPGRRVVVAFLTDARDLPKTPAARRAQWQEQLAATAHVSRLVEGMDLNRLLIRGFAAGSSIRATLSGPGWVAIGDAAAAYDPLSGQGLAASLTKGIALARLVALGPDLPAAIAQYTAAECEAFALYAQDRRRTYARAAQRFGSAFWNHHRLAKG